MTRSFLVVAAFTLVACASQQKVADPYVPTQEPSTVEITPAAPEADAPVAQEMPRFNGTTVHFGFDESLLTPAATRELQRVADAMRDHPSLKIEIAGHADDRGTTEYNLALGHRRADAARQYLMNLGVEGSRIAIISFGEERPAVLGDGEEAWAQNRRDEIAPR